ncbi:MAG: GerMN domain-containing protein [Synergistaceae bacterium]|jgi:hypothetical protein|nr:GerMN domain-containing protein [Synergistaceae bacterium]
MVRRRDNASSDRHRDDFSEREFEERVEARRKRAINSPDLRRTPRKNEKNRAPLLLRVLAWGGVILLCFVAGYAGTSSMLKLLDKQSFLKPDDRIQNREDAEKLLDEDPAAALASARLDMQKVALSLFYPREGKLTEERVEIISGIREENIRDAVHRLIDLSGFFGGEARVQHIFRNVDTVYLDFSGSFVSALAAAGANPSTLFITGVVRTLRDNFPPITKVRFLVDSKVTSAGAPVDLTATWQLPR